MSIKNEVETLHKAVKDDRYQSHDYYQIDELLTEEHLLARDAVRTWVKQEVSPILKITPIEPLVPSIYSKDWAKSALLVPHYQRNMVAVVWMK